MPSSSGRHIWLPWYININYGSSCTKLLNSRAFLFIGSFLCPRRNVKCFIHSILFTPPLYKVWMHYYHSHVTEMETKLKRSFAQGHKSRQWPIQVRGTAKWIIPPVKYQLSPIVTIPSICSYSREPCFAPRRPHWGDSSVNWLDQGKEPTG